MTAPTPPLALLARSATVLGTSLGGATHVLPTRETPCTRWDLGTLISHVADSVELLITSIGGSPSSVAEPDCRARARQRIHQLQLALTRAPLDHPDVELAALTGAFELTIHAWDITESTRAGTRLPADLVSTLLAFAPLVLGDLDRTDLFDPRRPITPGPVTDLDRLLALFGRQRKRAA